MSSNPEYMRQWRAANRDKCLEYARRERAKPGYCAKHTVAVARWRNANPCKAAKLVQAMNWRRLSRRLQVIHEKGGSCVRCGEQNPLLLQFDHADPSTKARVNGVKKRQSVTGSGTLETMRNATRDCQLLCANCHVLKTWYEQDFR